jgi:glycosyltransferase involved in cell wall biosynthesis
MSDLPLVTFGFVNCNRLYYLRSCVESFLETTYDYPNKEIIVVDNASSEPGTDEYLDELRDRGFRVFKQLERDPSNEYAKALNIIAKYAKGEYVAPIPADTQFVVKGKWLHEYVGFFERYEDSIGCISFDAQRRVRNYGGIYSKLLGEGDMKFLFHHNRNPVMGAANCLLSKEMLEAMYPWEVDNESHEGGQDSETKMLIKVAKYLNQSDKQVYYTAPTIPVSIAIFNEDGNTARVRKNKRYGKYVEPEDKVHYYETHDFKKVVARYGESSMPIGIEDIAVAVDWDLPLDQNGNWIKSKTTYNDVCQEI